MANALDIAEKTRTVDVDNRLSLQFYYRTASNLLQQASIYRDEGNVIDLYIRLLRFASLVSETIPNHRDYRTAPCAKAEYIKKLKSVLGELDQQKPEVQKEVDRLIMVHQVPTSSANQTEWNVFTTQWPSAPRKPVRLEEDPNKELFSLGVRQYHDPGPSGQNNLSSLPVISPNNSSVGSDKCKHVFCKDCLRRHAETAVKSGKSYITCPALGCEVLWSAKLSSEMLSSGSQLLLEQRQIEEAVPSAERVYCPYRDCSILQLRPDSQTPVFSSNHPHATAIGGVECLFCNRFFCLECQVPWHSEMSCEEFQRLPVDEKTAEDISFKNLASSKQWQRCTRCGFMVELKSGCYHITCRCGYDFCYTCGGAWASGHICKT